MLRLANNLLASGWRSWPLLLTTSIYLPTHSTIKQQRMSLLSISPSISPRMPKRNASGALSESAQTLPPVKKAKVDETIPQSSKRPAPVVNGADRQDDRFHPSKRARRNEKSVACMHSSDSDSWPFKPMPFIQSQPEEDPAVTAYWIQRERQVEAQIRQADSLRREHRQEYSRYRTTRLPSPAISTTSSDADANGYTPAMFDMEDDDSNIREVFGAAFAAQLQARSHLPRPRSPTVRLDEKTEMNNEVERIGAQSNRGLRVGNELEHGQHNQNAQDGQRCTAQPLRRWRPTKHTHTKRIPALTSQSCRRSARLGQSKTSDVARLQSSQRLTRQTHCNKFFYELDHHGKLRLMHVSILCSRANWHF